jgi:hypothetical protein
VNGGPILDPTTGAPFDVDATNVLKVLDSDHPTFQNPIIFDSDGAITGGGGVLGFFGALQFEDDFSAITEGFVVLNGAVMNPPALLSPTSFLGVFQHEFGHLAGPLDHEQSNGNLALFRREAVLPPGFTTSAQTFDLFTPFIETTYPFFFRAPATSVLRASGFPDSGYFIASLDMDTKNALSNLYPTAAYRATTGSIEGQVFVRTSGGKVPVSGINVVARRIDRAAYPPPLGTQAFPTAPTLDADGVPSPPPAQAATDSLSTVASAVTGLDFGNGTYRIQGLPPGTYEVMVQEILQVATGGSGIGPLTFQLTLPVLEEYFNGDTTSNVVSDFTPVGVKAGKVTRNINFEINGLDAEDAGHASEDPSHLTLATAQDLGALPARVVGSAGANDPFHLVVDFGGGAGEGIQDLYKFQVTQPSIVWMSLEPKNTKSGAGDLDLFLFRPSANPDVVLAGSAGNPRYSATATAHELIGVALGPGTWYIGVGAFAGSVEYELRVMKNVQ